ncbi:hypothetical protein H6F86_24780 [Phormidium sp. FACHB-592]|uniref:Transposase n=1 Tax=Stenomitos frigidus AS-A4 TaxID=2933935 RepID=A0ABV0KUU5_9CYAN|nr:hypothetical protein [Phormidium sp. FACHB-592]MBD2077044.1 hypothetical protein [Phormidium sp. FACHB-592]
MSRCSSLLYVAAVMQPARHSAIYGRYHFIQEKLEKRQSDQFQQKVLATAFPVSALSISPMKEAVVGGSWFVACKKGIGIAPGNAPT